MAEEGSQQDNQRLYKGLNTDVNPIDQPKGTYRFALNGVNETREGDTNFISNEEGNNQYVTLDYNNSNYTIIGNIYVDDNEHVVFGVTHNETKSFIALLTSNQELLIQIDDTDNSCLNFKLSHQIQGEYRLRNGCEKTTYWVDGLNPIRTLNLDKIDNLYKDGVLQCDALSLIKIFQKIPKIDDFEILAGGNIRSGTYNIAIQYVDESGNSTYWITVGQTTPIIVDSLTGAYINIKGSSNKDTHQAIGATETYDGIILFGEGLARKSIKWSLSNMDDSYNYYKVAIIVADAGLGETNKVYVSSLQFIKNSDNFYVFDGNLNNYTESTVEEIFLTPTIIESAQHIEQVENRLLVANTNGTEYDLCALQKYASKITTKYVVDLIKPYDATVVGDPKNPNTYWERMSAMGDEVYALGIVYIFDDNTESPAYHIPGRPDDKIVNTDPNSDKYLFTVYNHDLSPFVIGTYNVGDPLGVDPGTEADALIEKWRVYDTSENFDMSTAEIPRKLQFWECQNSNYIPRPYIGCNDGDYWGVDGYNGDPIAGAVRHHKFPSRNNVPVYTKTNDGDLKNFVRLKVKISIKPGQVWPYGKQSMSGFISYLVDDAIPPASPDFNEHEQTFGFGFVDLQDDTVIHTINLPWVSADSADSVDLNSIELFNPICQHANYTVNGLTPTVPCPDAIGAYVWQDNIEYEPGEEVMLSVTDIDIYVCNVDHISATGDVINGAPDQPNQLVWDKKVFLDVDITVEEQVTNAPDILNVALIGVEFDNIDIPLSEGVKGYYFVRGDRDLFNRTVLGKAYSNSCRRDSKWVVFNSISDSGWDNGDNTFDPKFEYSNTSKWLLSPENMFKNQRLQPSYIKAENYYDKYSYTETLQYTRDSITQSNVNDQSSAKYLDDDGFDWGGGYTINSIYRNNTNTFSEANRKINDNLHITAMSNKQGITDYDDNNKIKTFYNVSCDNNVQMVNIPTHYDDTSLDKLDFNASPYTRLYYVSEKIEVDVHSVIENIRYYKMHNNPQYTEDAKTLYGFDTFISNFDVSVSSIQGNYTNHRVWEFVIDSVIVALAAVATILTLGTGTPLLVAAVVAIAVVAALNITILALEAFYKDWQKEGLWKPGEHQTRQNLTKDLKKDDHYLAGMDHLQGMFIESEINIGLREKPTYGALGYMSDKSSTGAGQYMKFKFLYNDLGSDRVKIHPLPVNEAYQYNLDFSRLNKEKIWFSLALSYDCCSRCLEKFPNRIYYSEKSFIEEVSDSYGIFLPLNYIDIPGEHGEITNIFAVKNALYAHTKSILWYIPQNIQERLTGDIISLVGTGGFFDSPPRPVHDDDIGAAGSTQKFATIKTKYGVFFVDSTEGKIYTLNFSSQTGTQIEELSDTKRGMSKWFRYNIPMNLYDDIYKLSRYKYPYISNPVNEIYGTGFSSALDEENKRIIFTKRDYSITSEWQNNFEIINDSAVFDGATTACIINPGVNPLYFNKYDNKFYTAVCDGEDKNWTLVLFGDDTIFINKSWTISYSIISGAWTSWHSYIPTGYIYDHLNLYSISTPGTSPPNTVDEYRIWKHNTADIFTTFYNVTRSHIIDYVAMVNPLETTILNDITIQTQATKFDVEQRYTTFNKLIVYNSRQCSGELELVPTDYAPDADFMMRSVKNELGKVTIKKLDKDWKINDLKDYRINYDIPIFVEDWDSIKSEYFIDKVVNVSSIDFTKDWTQLELFRDKYLRVRLTLSGISNTKLTTNYLFEREKSVNQ